MEEKAARPTVFAEQHEGSEVADALREHRKDRDALLASLTASLQADMRVRAAWLWGSFGRGDADDLSDLDPWLVVADEAVGEMGASLRLYAERTGSLITGGESSRNAPPGGGSFSALHEGRHGLLHVDCYWQPEAAAVDVPERAVLFNRLDAPPLAAPAQLTPPQSHVSLNEEEERIADGIGFTWLMLSITAKTLARRPDSDMALMLYPRLGLEDAAALLGFEEMITAADWTVPERPADKVERLRHLAGKTARLTEAANKKGMNLPLLSAVCLSRYLDMVESILR